MTIVTSLTRACSSAASRVGAASVEVWSRRPTIQWTDRASHDISRLDERFQVNLQTQLETARRYDRHFTLTSTTLGDVDLALVVATACEQHIRVLDAVTLIDDSLVLLWGSTERSGAATALERLIAEGVLPPSSLERSGAATFPVDGLTAVSLTEAAARVGTLPMPQQTDRPTRPPGGATALRSLHVEGRRTNGDELEAVGG